MAFATLAELAAFVHRELCAADALDPAQTPLFRTPVTRGGRACGVVFHVEGPRLLRTSAVWSADDDRVLFYDSTGTRSREVRLSESPPVAAPVRAAYEKLRVPRTSAPEPPYSEAA